MGVGLNVLLPIILIELVLLLVALIDCIRAERTNGPKWVWVLVILFISLFGPIAYFIFGRKNR